MTTLPCIGGQRGGHNLQQRRPAVQRGLRDGAAGRLGGLPLQGSLQQVQVRPPVSHDNAGGDHAPPLPPTLSCGPGE